MSSAPNKLKASDFLYQFSIQYLLKNFLLLTYFLNRDAKSINSAHNVAYCQEVEERVLRYIDKVC